MSTDTTDDTPAQRRLREARERAAERESNPGDAIRLPQPGEVAHALISGTSLYRGDLTGGAIILQRGQQFTITSEMISASRNVRGEWRGIALLHHPNLQAYFHKGRILYAAGPTPEGFQTWDSHGDASWAEQRERARLDAHAQRTEAERHAALRAVHDRFGPAQPTTNFVKYISASERAWEEDERVRRAAALAGEPYLGFSSTGGGE